MAAVLYASVSDLKAVLSGTDSGTGTPAQLSDAQLTLALTSASSRVSIYAGAIYDGSTADAQPPPAFHDLALDLAAFWAWRTYLKGKAVPATHPSFIAYKDAQQILNDVRDGKLRLDPAVAPSIGSETGMVINRIPPVFTGNDSNTRLNPMTGTLESDIPYTSWSPRGLGWGGDDMAGGPIYQG